MYMRIPMFLLMLVISLPVSGALDFSKQEEEGSAYLVIHRPAFSVKAGRKVLAEKVASLCLAANYDHYVVIDGDADAPEDEDEDGTVLAMLVRFESGAASGRIDCDSAATSSYVADAREQLVSMGLLALPERRSEPETRGGSEPQKESSQPPASARTDTEEEVGVPACTIEQIASMARSGLTDAQIKAACSGIAD